MPEYFPSLDKSVSFVTMGCAKNEVDSESMAKDLTRAGYSISDDLENADVIVINTCSFIQAATEESIDAILEAAGLPNVECGKSKLIVAGCLPARYHGELDSEFPEVADFLECSQEKDIVSRVDNAIGVERVAGTRYAIQYDEATMTVPFAYVKISDGCNRFCSYCTIPFIRGRYHSFSFDQIESDVSSQIESGAREIVLIAQDTGRWGDDFDPPCNLSSLLGKLAGLHPDTWFRVMYIQPEGVTDELIETIASHENLCSYFDIPFQHVNQSILKAMNRHGSNDSYIDLVEKIRARIPDAAVRTTLIAGFPGETDDMFDELCSFVELACLDYVGVFAYSREEGTRAFDLPRQIDEEEKRYRAQQLRDLADSVSNTVIQQRVGSQCKVLVCGAEDDGQLFGRTQLQAPDVDGVTYLDSGAIGSFVEATIDDTLLYEMEGSVLP